MSNKLEKVGGVITALYFLIVVVFISLRVNLSEPLTLNDLGSFLSGAFGPVAFLWLVLVFVQQCRALKVSSDALILQTEELRHSVEQQTIIAQAATEISKAAIEANEINKAEMEWRLKANFKVVKEPENYEVFPGVIGTKLTYKNEGNDASDVKIIFTPMIKGAPFFLGEIRRGESKTYPFSTTVYGPADMEIRYTGVDGEERSEFYTYTVSPAPYDVTFQRKPPVRP